MLELAGLTVTYPDGTRAIDRLSLTIDTGESVALVGANGAGKTSLILALVGVIPAQGDVVLDGVRLDKKSVRTIRARVGVVFQNPDDQLFLPSVFENVAFGLRGRGLSETEITERVERTLVQLGILHLKDRTALRLSGGEKRMAALATVLAMEPTLMLFDEPTAFLDLRARRRLAQVLYKLPQAKLIATHDLAFAAELCTRAVALDRGVCVADGPAETLLYDAARMEACGVEALRR